jgi:nudix motif 8
MVGRVFKTKTLNRMNFGSAQIDHLTGLQVNIDIYDKEINDLKVKDEIKSYQLQDKFNESIGVFKESESEDIKVLVNNFTAPALALALRDRESVLQNAAMLAHTGNIKDLNALLYPFLKQNVARRRIRKHDLDLSNGFTRKAIVIIQRYLHRMPRQVFHAAERRASVVIPLCNVNGVASILFERRSSTVRTHKQQVCFPGGMLDEGVDSTIIQTSLREMEEELGIAKEKIEVLGILRCNWNEVASMTGIDVTPVVGFIGELTELTLTPNSDEVEDFFTVPLETLLDEDKWLSRNFSTPVFTGGPHIIWGLTAYLLERFLKDVVLKSISGPGGGSGVSEGK